MRRFLRENGPSLVLFFCFFLLFIAGQTYTGYLHNNEELRDHGRPAEGLGEYLTGSHFLEATTENFESEFLQMFAYVLLTAFLYQKGSSESKPVDAPHS